MWQLDWGTPPVTEAEPHTVEQDSRSATDAEPARVGGLMWEEHCHECAEPDCYTSCPLFVRRKDGRCARLEYGIFANPAFSGLFPFGADVTFRRWGKLESVIPVRSLSTARARQLARADRVIVTATERADGLRGWPARHQVTAAYRASRITALRSAPTTDFDAFRIELWSCEEAPFRLVIECTCSDTPYFRESLTVVPGWNRMSLSAQALLSGAVDPSARLRVYPENDATVRVVFTWLDLVSLSPEHEPDATAETTGSAPERVPADKVKCVVWDLDNTLWNGILADVGPDELVLADGVREVIDQLDERGILQSVASKNDHEQAWQVIQRLGLEDIFLYPAIHWGPKSASVREIAKSLNIGLDTFAFIDDSPTERAEVAEELPEVRVFSHTEVGVLLDLDPFDVKPSQEAKGRRLSYLAEARRRAVLASSVSVDVEQFLRSCVIEVELSAPAQSATVERCHELLLRSNQLNLTTRRYSREELDALIADPTRAALTVRVKDRFGDYGLVGFLSLGAQADGSLVIEDLVLSCRVAKKYVENAVLEAVRGLVATAVPEIRMTFVPTARNGALLDALRTLGVDGATEPLQGPTVLRLVSDRPIPFADVAAEVRVDDSARGRVAVLVTHLPRRSAVEGTPVL